MVTGQAPRLSAGRGLPRPRPRCAGRPWVTYQRLATRTFDGITTHDPDGLEIVFLWLSGKVPATGPPPWLYWYH